MRDDTSGEGGQTQELGLPRLGYKVFKWLIVVVFVMLGLVAFFAWSTHPDPDRYLPKAASTLATPEQAKAWGDAWTAWLMSIKELGQVFLLTPVFPLIGAVLGYIFGREAAHGAVKQAQEGQQKAGPATQQPPDGQHHEGQQKAGPTTPQPLDGQNQEFQEASHS
jgi:hypothetical protein